MGWIRALLGKNTGIAKKEQEHINRMFMIAALENRLEPSDINLITAQLPFIRYRELSDKKQQITTYRKDLPATAKEQFVLIYKLITSVMRYGALSERKEAILSKIIEVVSQKKERTQELVTYIKANIRNGLGPDESFLRLGYLLAEPKYIR